jgi:hypothetical protein
VNLRGQYKAYDNLKALPNIICNIPNCSLQIGHFSSGALEEIFIKKKG